MPKIFLPFGSLSPDLGHFNNPGMLDVRNVIPLSGKYVAAGGNTVRATIGTATATAGTPPIARGIHAHSKGAGAYDVYVGTNTNLLKYDPAAAWGQTVVTRSVGGAYNCLAAGGENGWQFLSAGATVVATNGADAVQARLAGASTFENLFTSSKKPTAKFVMMVNENLVCLNTNDGGTAQPRRAWWTQSNAFQNIGDRVTNPTYIGTGYQDLEDELGHITGGIGMGAYGVIFKEEGFVLMSGPTGATEISNYRFDKVRGPGSIHPNAIAILGDEIFFWSDGPCKLSNGAASRIGETAILRTLIDAKRYAGTILVDLETYDSREHIWCRADKQSGLVFWGLTTRGRTSAAASGPSLAYQQGDLLLCYNTQEDRLSFVEPISTADLPNPIGIPYACVRPPDAAREWYPGSDLLGIQRLVDASGPAAWVDSIATLLGDAGDPEALLPAATFEWPYNPWISGQQTSAVAMRPWYRVSDELAAGGHELVVAATIHSRDRPWDLPDSVDYTISTGDGWLYPTDPTELVDREFHSIHFEFRSGSTARLMDAIELEGIELELRTGSTTRKA